MWGNGDVMVWRQLDRTGILLLIWGSVTSFVWIVYGDDRRRSRQYSSMLGICTVSANLGLFAPMNVDWPLPCLLLGSAALVPVLHALTVKPQSSIVSPFVRFVAVSIVGGLCYVSEVFGPWEAATRRGCGQMAMHLLFLHAIRVYTNHLYQGLIDLDD